MAAASLRFQFVVPMLLAVIATALGVTVCSKWFADMSLRYATLAQLSSTGSLCVNAKYPLTESVLSQIQELSSLRIAIVNRVASAATNSEMAFRLESKSSSFPDVIGRAWVGELADKAATLRGKPFFESVELGDGTLANATAYALPQDPNSNRQRYLLLLQSQMIANTTAVQAFVLPLVTGLFSSIAIFLVAALVASRIGNRIERLSEHVKKIAEGSFATIAPTGPLDAIHTLYESVNWMSSQLRESSSQIAQNERSRMINLMASGMAHELRNHLTGARLAIQTCTPDPSTQEALSVSLKQMRLAEESIQRLLTLRVDTADELTAPMTMQRIHDSVRELILPIANHKRVEFRMSACCGEQDEACEESVMATPIGDGSSIVGALINLVLNAMEAAGPGGEVLVWAKQIHEVKGGVSEAIEWSVRDNGPGPTKEMAAVMFEPFATTKREGVGLGLAMCKRIAQRHNGEVHWHRDGGFTVFTMLIRGLIRGPIRGVSDTDGE